MPDGENYSVRLDRTAFFPEAGGQTPDRGILRIPIGEETGETDASFHGVIAQVVDVQIDDENGVITHTVDCALPVGEEVLGRVDRAHRLDFMQQHSGEHIFSGLVCGRYDCDNVGFHLSEQTVTMDYNRALSVQELQKIEERANEVIWQDLEILIGFPDEEELRSLRYRSKKELSGQIRIVTIPGVDVCACCAPHVRRTGEIGLLKILNVQNYKGGVRVTIACGKRAFDCLSSQSAWITGMAKELSTAPEEVPGQLKRLRGELSETRRLVSQMGEQLLEHRLRELSESGSAKAAKCLLIFDAAADAGAARRVLNHWMESHGGLCAVFLGCDTGGYQFVIGRGKAAAGEACPPEDMGETAQEEADFRDARAAAGFLAGRLGARGGGSPQMAQGSVAATEAEIRACLQ